MPVNLNGARRTDGVDGRPLWGGEAMVIGEDTPALTDPALDKAGNRAPTEGCFFCEEGRERLAELRQGYLAALNDGVRDEVLARTDARIAGLTISLLRHSCDAPAPRDAAPTPRGPVPS